MPGYDRSGPMGAGPGTGGGFGYCGVGTGVDRPWKVTGGFGFRRGWGARQYMGRPCRASRRFRNWMPPANAAWQQAGVINDEAGMLQAQADRIREELSSIEARLKQLQQTEENN